MKVVPDIRYSHASYNTDLIISTSFEMASEVRKKCPMYLTASQRFNVVTELYCVQMIILIAG